MKEGDLLILKVPQIIFARRLRRAKGFVDNDAYLNGEIFARQFYEPAQQILGSALAGFIFEQEYHPKKDRSPAAELAQDLDLFFSKIPKDTRYHIELRTEAYLAKPLFGILEKHGVGLVLSHWTWLPPLWKQFTQSGEKSFNAGREVMIRLITPLRMSYEDSYTQAFPFDKLVDGMLNPEMVEDAVRLILTGINRKVRVNLIINNRAGGNAPMIAQQIAERFIASG
jgi:hypothetical protein